jgi:hypothetical protein
MKLLGTDVHGACSFYSVFVPNFPALERSALPPPPMVVLIAADALELSVDIVARVAERFLDAGLGVICAWGTDCERVHDIFDEEYVGDGTIERDSPMVSTWHAHESLEDVVEFFAVNGISLLGSETRPVSHLAIAVGNPEWVSAIERVLSPFALRRS